MTTNDRTSADPVGADLIRLLRTSNSARSPHPDRTCRTGPPTQTRPYWILELLADEVYDANPVQPHYERPKPDSTPMRFDTWTALDDYATTALCSAT